MPKKKSAKKTVTKKPVSKTVFTTNVNFAILIVVCIFIGVLLISIYK